MELRYKKILIISPEYWGINHVSKHHYAVELSKKNIVYFLNPPSDKYQVIEILKNLFIVDYTPIIRGINKLTPVLRNFINKILIGKLKKKCKTDKFDIIWSFDPFRFQNLNLFGSPLTIYHPVDVHYTSKEREIVQTASIVFTTCEIIKNSLKPFNLNFYNIGHGLSETFIMKEVNYIEKRSGPVKVCMMGNLQRKIDYNMIFSLIEAYPRIEFHFIGPYSSNNLSRETYYEKEIDKLKTYKNTFLHGPVDQNRLGTELNKMDIFLLLYNENENPASRANPHKLLEFLSTGKVILSYLLDEYQDQDDLLVMTSDKEEIPGLFSKIVNKIHFYNSPEKMRARKNFAHSNSYRKKLSQIELLINKYVSKNI